MEKGEVCHTTETQPAVGDVVIMNFSTECKKYLARLKFP